MTTIDTDAEHEAALAPSFTAQGIAQSCISIAIDDLLCAHRALRAGSNNDAIEAFEKAAESIEQGKRMLTGTIWQIDA